MKDASPLRSPGAPVSAQAHEPASAPTGGGRASQREETSPAPPGAPPVNPPAGPPVNPPAGPAAGPGTPAAGPVANPGGGPAPALRRGLAVLRLLAARPSPVSAGAIARDLGLARSTTYELLTELANAGLAVHLPTQRRWGLGVGAFEIGTAYLRSEPLERLGRPILSRLAAGTGSTAHLGILHGPQTLYLVKERPAGSAVSLVTEVGIRLPAALTATGLSILADLSAGQVRALFPDAAAFVDRTGRGPRSLPELRTLLAHVRRSRWASEDGQVTAGTASVAAAVFDHNAMPIAAIGITVPHRCTESSQMPSCTFDALLPPVRQAVAALTAAIGGRPPERAARGG